MKKKQDYEILFWKEWLEGDVLHREQIVERLPLVRDIWDFKNMPTKMRTRFLTTQLNSFFEDLE